MTYGSADDARVALDDGSDRIHPTGIRVFERLYNAPFAATLRPGELIAELADRLWKGPGVDAVGAVSALPCTAGASPPNEQGRHGLDFSRPRSMASHRMTP